MQTVNRVAELREAVDELRAEGGTLALVPTMGALHDGHLALVREASRRANHVAVSIFVNPTQFGPEEDFEVYPRSLAADRTLLEAEGVSLVWAPDIEAMYPHGFATTVSVPGVSEPWEGASRPGHFDGVATVVLKLFEQVRPDVAVFGEKDWQQLAVIRRMAHDLDLTQPAAEAIVGMPTVREADGLARSSRNAYLSPEDRAAAAALPREMRAAVAAIEAGENVTLTLERLEVDLIDAGFSSIDYAALADAASLAALRETRHVPMRLLVAARIGGTRLIDNMPVTITPASVID